MTIATYSELVTEMGAWLNRADISDRIPTFIRLFEARMNRRLRSPEMEQVATVSTIAGTEGYAFPSGFREARQIYIDAVPRINLVPMSPQSLRTEFTGQESAAPSAYAVIDEQIVLAPPPTEADTLVIVYYRALSGLTAGNPTNWLLDNHPDAYLFGSLCMAEAYLQDDQRLNVWKAAWDEALGEIIREGNAKRLPGGPLATRPAVIE
jgi:hypothetical protein